MAQKLSAEELGAIFPELDEILDHRLRQGVIEIWQEIAAEMRWGDLREIPKNNSTELGRSLIQHIQGVTAMALALCRVADAVQGKPFDRDLLIAACLLHDCSKPVEYEPRPEAIADAQGLRAGQASELGSKMQHAAYAVHKILQKGLPMDLAHLVLTHTHASAMRGKSWEAAALFYADFADTDAALDRVGGRMFLQRWALT